VREPIEPKQDDFSDSPIVTESIVPVSLQFFEALAGGDELLVSSREAGREGTVPAWFVLDPPVGIYLFTYAYAIRVQRWRNDPWVRLSVPGTAISIEGTVRFVGPGELTEGLSCLVVDRWGMWGATTPEGLRRMLVDGSHVLVRVILQA
jgi:hypothetical protein